VGPGAVLDSVREKTPVPAGSRVPVVHPVAYSLYCLNYPGYNFLMGKGLNKPYRIMMQCVRSYNEMLIYHAFRLQITIVPCNYVTNIIYKIRFEDTGRALNSILTLKGMSS
jgi:hypothetical protein